MQLKNKSWPNPRKKDILEYVTKGINIPTTQELVSNNIGFLKTSSWISTRPNFHLDILNFSYDCTFILDQMPLPLTTVQSYQISFRECLWHIANLCFVWVTLVPAQILITIFTRSSGVSVFLAWLLYTGWIIRLTK